MPVKQRARKDEDKLARRRAILDAAARMLRRQGYASLTMAEVARRCHLAKGTLYLYFHSKEALFLAALEHELTQWFDDLMLGLTTLAPEPDAGPAKFAATIASTLAARPTLMDLLSIVHNVLEQNIEPETALSFKRMLVQRLAFGGAVLEQVLPRLPKGAGTKVLLRIYAAVVGLRQLADPSPVVAAVLERPEMEALRVDFEVDLTDMIVDLIVGAQARADTN
jgi:AcrR family transcriptional regulator